MKDDLKIAKQMVSNELDRHIAFQRQHPNVEYKYWSAEMGPLPNNAGYDATFIHVVMGVRHELSKKNAMMAALGFCNARERYPDAEFYLNLMGYDADPREIWEHEEAARYVRRWARFAGLNSPDDVKVKLAHGGIGFLGACGCWGEAYKQEVIRRFREQNGQVRAS
jgi:hypothetical protein